MNEKTPLVFQEGPPVDRFAGCTESDPPSERLPLVVTEPLNVIPLTEPVPDTDVTVPVFAVAPLAIPSNFDACALVI